MSIKINHLILAAPTCASTPSIQASTQILILKLARPVTETSPGMLLNQERTSSTILQQHRVNSSIPTCSTNQPLRNIAGLTNYRWLKNYIRANNLRRMISMISMIKSLISTLTLCSSGQNARTTLPLFPWILVVLPQRLCSIMMVTPIRGPPIRSSPSTTGTLR